MRNRIAQRHKSWDTFKDIFLPILVFAAIGTLFILGLNNIGKTSEEERLRSVEKAITKATVQCYAVEGRYPPSLGYLEDNYGLLLDYDNYIIQYNAFATNIMPTILVMPKDFENYSSEVLSNEDGV